MTVKILPRDHVVTNLLANAELHFDAADGLLAGLRLVGFAIWERRPGDPTMRSVTFPARTYASPRARFALLRPIQDVQAQAPITQLILDAYAAHERAQADAQAFDAAVPLGMAMARKRRRMIS